MVERSKRQKRLGRLTAAATLLLSLTAAAGQLHASEPPKTYKNPIVFCRTHKDDSGLVVASSKLWVMEQDGSGLRQLTFGPTREDHPTFYADRRHVFYAEHPWPRLKNDLSSKLVKLDIYSGEKEVLTQSSATCNINHPSLSPLEEIPAYHVDCESPSRHAQRVGIGDASYEANVIAHNGVALPDGIIFMHEKNRGYSPREVSIARLIGHGIGAQLVFLTDDKRLHRRPAISPDGKWLAWQTNAAGAEDEIFMARIDGSGARNMTNAPGNDGHPWFSKDGTKIVFESDRRGTWEIWILDVATRAAKQLTFGGKKFTSTRARM